jgi:methyl coenzyme M reductase gamma subunit
MPSQGLSTGRVSGRSIHEMTELELEAMIQRAAEAGAKKALRDVGLKTTTLFMTCVRYATF